ncbi:hypothetical protein [Gemmata sp.]|uniref:hypothetical protein n=1 Tax=Gemmata sp. TaxID=1914242 RepID=UPI003F7124BE
MIQLSKAHYLFMIGTLIVSMACNLFQTLVLQELGRGLFETRQRVFELMALNDEIMLHYREQRRINRELLQLDAAPRADRTTNER